MQKSVSPFIILAIFNRLCGTTSNPPKNTGHRGAQCLEGVMIKSAVARNGFAFASIEDFENLEKWKEAIAAKDIIPLYDSYVITAANTEATNYTTGNFSYETAPATKITTFESYLGFCSHAALKSVAKTEYDQIFEFNNDGSVVGVDAGPGTGTARKVKGQNLKELNVGMRQVATSEKPATTLVRLTYEDYNELEDNAVVIKPSWSASDVEGIFDVDLELVSATSTTIKFKAHRDCSSALVTTLEAGDIVVKNAAGVTQTVTFVEADADGVYTLTGTSVANGWTVALDGVVVQTEITLEGTEPLVVSGVS